MSPRSFFVITVAVLLVPLMLVAQGKTAGEMTVPDIPYTLYTLDNGLRVIVHEDHKAPIVAVNVWYHVGSKNEKSGKTGFAHLFEHLMFNGSENYNDDYFQEMERLGATDMNGTTNEDRTNYFENVPVSAFDIALWMESDRMGHLLGAIDQGKLDEQRGVVQNEKRQGENEPYAIADELITKAVWPASHPYAHTVIGSMEDLNAASLADVKEWFKTYYGTANAVLSIAGDVTPAAALEKVKTYFGDIPSGPPVAHFNAWVAKRTGTIREHAEDRVPQARVYKVWNVPGWASHDAQYLQLVTSLLTSGKSSRLYKRLVYDDQSATTVSAYLDRREIASLFIIEATAKPGGDLAAVEKAIDEELTRFIAKGPTEAELQRAKMQYDARFVRGIERIGGFGGKSDILAQNAVFGGSPDFYKTSFAWLNSATAQDVQKAAGEWLSDGQYILDITPFANYTAAPPDTTLRKKLPAEGKAPEVRFPLFERSTLSNGMKIILVKRTAVPVINMQMLFHAGYASDHLSSPGTASLAMNMLDEGTRTRTALQISDELQVLGATLGTGSGIDYSSVSFSALKANLDQSLDLFADVILHPSFPEQDFGRLQQQTLARIKQERSSPISMGIRVLPGLLYGKDNPYGEPLTGSGFEETVSKLTRAEMVKFHDTWMKPNNATLIIVGDASMGEMVPKLEKLFKDWKRGDVPKIPVPEVAEKKGQSMYIMDKPGALQSTIFAAHLTLPVNNPDEIAVNAMNTVLGGAFTSRINMNLREAKHWSYGAGSVLLGTGGQRPFIAYAPVQTDKTAESVVEVNKELHDVVGTRPPSTEEVAKVKNNLTLELPGLWETDNAILGAIARLVQFNLPEDYYQTYPGKVEHLSVSDVDHAAVEAIHPDQVVWMIVGDRAKIEKPLRDLNMGPIEFIDSNGNVIK
ncbi:MAG: pitrilysin family protein [Bacteroidota bacterium]